MPGPAIPTAGICSQVEQRERRAHRADLPAFRRLRRLRAAALERRRAIAPGSATSWSRRWRRPALDAPVDDLIDAHGEGRRRAVFHARRGTHDVLEVGFAAARAHQHRCRSTAVRFSRPASTARSRRPGRSPKRSMPARKPLDIQVTATEAGLDIDVRGSGPLTAARRRHSRASPSAHRLARLTRHGELVAQRVAPTVRMGRARVALPPGAFLQATAAGEAALAAAGRWSIARGARPIADLFSGVGPFALRLAERARVTAVDNDAEPRSPRSSAPPRRRKVSSRLRRRCATCSAGRSWPAELKRFDAVVFDPPRQGAEAQARELAASSSADRRRGVMQSGDLRARCAHPRSTAAIGSRASRRSTSSAIRAHVETGRAVRALTESLSSPSGRATSARRWCRRCAAARACAGTTRRSGVRPAISSTSLVRIASLNCSRVLDRDDEGARPADHAILVVDVEVLDIHRERSSAA